MTRAHGMGWACLVCFNSVRQYMKGLMGIWFVK